MNEVDGVPLYRLSTASYVCALFFIFNCGFGFYIYDWMTGALVFANLMCLCQFC